MDLLSRHALATLIGLILAALAVAWIRPLTAGGTTFIVVLMLLFVNAIGGILGRTRKG